MTENSSVGRWDPGAENLSVNKYALYLFSTLFCLSLGGGTMYLLLADEGKWGNPRFMPEFYGGTLILGVAGAALGVLAVKSYPFRLASSRKEPGREAWLCLLHWGTMAMWVVGVLAFGAFLGLVNRENGAFVIFGVAFLEGLYTVWMDRDYGSKAA